MRNGNWLILILSWLKKTFRRLTAIKITKFERIDFFCPPLVLTFAIVRAQCVQQVNGGAAQQLLPQRVATPQFQIQTALRRHIAARHKEPFAKLHLTVHYCLCTLHHFQIFVLYPFKIQSLLT